ncbi:MAG: bifunctional nuclease family protein [Ignavibacteria bacterium]|nr:bifunctional nuclease family protein [Ignavibacteria bacterium]
MERVQVDILGLSTSSSSGGAYALILKEMEGNRRLPIIIGAFEAQAIALEIEGVKPPRPMTHDLLKNVIEAAGISVVDVTISELREGTFYARIAFESALNEDIDSRPSDAIALAVRFGVPIFVAEDVLGEAGYVPEGEEDTEPAQTSAPTLEPKEQKLEALQQKLQDAIQQEDYEEAARMRDEIRRLQASD